MSWHFSAYTACLLIAAAVSATLGGVVWLRRDLALRVPFVLMVWAVAEWSLLTALEATAVGVPAKVMLSKAQYIGIVSSPVLLLIFALAYTGHQQWLTWRHQVWLWVIPGITLLLAWTNEWHLWIWASFTPSPEPGSNILIYNHGPAFYLAIVYIYLALLASSVVLAWALWGHGRLYRRQSIALLIAIAVPWVANIIYISGLSPWPGVDLTPVAFAISGAALGYSLYRFQLLDLMPIAADALVAHMADGIMVLDRQERIVKLNATTQGWTGLTAKAIGRPAGPALAEQPELAAACREAPGGCGEVRLAGPQERWLEVQPIPLHDRQGRPVGRLVVLHDTTARKQAAEALAAANAALGQRLAELESRNQELDAFARTVAHDLRNPLGQVLTLSELLMDGAVGPGDMQDVLICIRRGGDRMLRIIEELLLLAQVRTADVKRDRLDMAAIVQSALDALAPLITASGAEVLVQPDGWPVAWGHAAWVEQVWVNYLSNALKYGGRPPLLQLGGERQGDGQTRFWVRDNGMGLSPEEQAQLFLPFEQGEQMRVTGYGLGLSIVRRIVAKLGGQVDVQSTLGQGSVFCFTLPRADEPMDAHPQNGTATKSFFSEGPVIINYEHD